MSPNYDYWNIFRVAKAVSLAIKIGIFSTWTDNRTVLLGEGQPGAGDWRFDYIADGFEKDEKRFPPQPSDKHIAVIDRVVSEEAASAIVEQGPDLSWVYLQHTDDVGHEQGDGEAFDAAVVGMEANVGRIWRAVQARQATHSEDWLVIVTTDHGRDALTGRDHGGHSERERTIWIATNSQRLLPGFDALPKIVDIYPSIAMHLGITIPEQVARHLDAKTVPMQVQPHRQKTPRNQSVVVVVVVHVKQTPKRNQRILRHRKRLKRNKLSSVELTQLGWFDRQTQSKCGFDRRTNQSHKFSQFIRVP